MTNLIRLSEEHIIAFKEEMQEAFQHGFMAYYKDDNQWQVLPDKDFYQSLEAEGAEAYEAISEDGQRVGGAIITANGNMGELAFLYAYTSTSIAADSMPLSFSMSITLTPICLSSLTRRTDYLSLKRG